jgi:hypothetical protein
MPYRSSRVGGGAGPDEICIIPKFDDGGSYDAGPLEGAGTSDKELEFGPPPYGLEDDDAICTGKPPIPCGATLPGGAAKKEKSVEPPKLVGEKDDPASMAKLVTPPGRVDNNSGLSVDISFNRGVAGIPLEEAMLLRASTTAFKLAKILA